MRIKENSQPIPVTTVSTLPKITVDESRYQKALDHKNRLIDYDKKKKAYQQLHTYEGNKNDDPYSKVSRNDDAVQAMDKMCLYAKVATVRDRQRNERKLIEEIHKKKEAKLDLMVELERIKELKRLEDLEKELVKKHQEGNKVIFEQIAENKKERLRQKELEEKERLEILKKIEREKEEDRKMNLLKAQENEKRVQESLEANRKAILEKKKRIQAEKEEDLRIEKYNREKAIKEEALFQEKKRLEHEKELELQKLREKQEKQQDYQAELDAIRAKRAVEDNERKQRQQEKEEQIQRQKKLEDLIRANAKQKLDKELQLCEEAKKEKDEFERIIKEQQKAIEEQKRLERIKIQTLLDHNKDLRIQIGEKEERERLNRREILEEGRKKKQERDDYQRNIEAIRLDKIKQLRNMGIDEKYIEPLQRFSLNDLYSAS